jgi:hypothetical protein
LWFTGNTEDVDENVPDMRTNTNWRDAIV